MFVPAPPAQPAVGLTPAGIVSSVLPQGGLPLPRSATSLAIGRADLNVLDGHPASVSGVLRPGLAGRMVALQELGRHGWHTVARVRTARQGRFRLRFTPSSTGSQRVRVRFGGDATHLGTHRRVGSLNAYRLAGASWYGGGGGLACGGTLTGATMGVANKTLPCGTLVTLHYGARTVRVPVIDRGPYVAGREFDLTEATKQALGFGDTGMVWTTR